MIKLDVIKHNDSANVIGLCKRQDVGDDIPLFQHTLCVNSLIACYIIALIIFQQSIECKYICNKQWIYFFSDAHGAMNHRGSIAKLTGIPSGFIHFARATYRGS